MDGRKNDRKSVQTFINRERHKLKRHERTRSHQSTAPVGWRPPTPLSRNQELQGLSRRERSIDQDAGDHQTRDTSPEDEELELNRHVYSTPNGEDNSVAASVQPNILSLLSTTERRLSQVDPFASLPLKLDRAAQALFVCSRELLLDQSMNVTWKNPALSKAVGLSFAYRNALQLCSTLSATSSYLDALHRRGVSLETSHWKAAAMQHMNLLISDPATRYGDDTLLGITALLFNEVLTTGSENCHIHSKGITQLLKHRGCYQTPQTLPSVAYYMCPLFIVTSKGQIAYLNHIQPDATGIEDTLNWKTEHDFFLLTLRKLHFSGLQSQNARPLAAGIKSHSFSQFMLGSICNPRDEFEHSYQLFVICYLALTIYEHRSSNSDCARLLRQYCTQFQQLFEDYGPGCQLQNIAWICLQDLDGNQDRKWHAFRMVRVIHRVSDRTRLGLQNFLLGVFAAAVGHPPVMLSQHDLLTVSQEALAGLPIAALGHRHR